MDSIHQIALIQQLDACRKQVSELLIELEELRLKRQVRQNFPDEETWTSKDYRRAALRHKYACDFMLKANDTNKEIYLTIYYLSGYILECIFKFYILESEHKIRGVTKEDLDKMGLKTHNLNILWQKVCDKGINKRNFIWGKLAENWTESIRYRIITDDFRDSQLLIDYYQKTVVTIHDTLKNKY